MEATGSEAGDSRVDVVMYALSTCVWCSMAKNLLGKLGVAYRYIHVDLLPDGEREKARAEMGRWNPRGSYPTLVFGNERAVLGYDEGKIRAELGR